MTEFIRELLRTTPFITCESGNGYRVVMRFSKLDHAQSVHEALLLAILAERGPSPAPAGEMGQGEVQSG